MPGHRDSQRDRLRSRLGGRGDEDSDSEGRRQRRNAGESNRHHYHSSSGREGNRPDNSRREHRSERASSRANHHRSSSRADHHHRSSRHDDGSSSRQRSRPPAMRTIEVTVTRTSRPPVSRHGRPEPSHREPRPSSRHERSHREERPSRQERASSRHQQTPPSRRRSVHFEEPPSRRRPVGYEADSEGESSALPRHTRTRGRGREAHDSESGDGYETTVRVTSGIKKKAGDKDHTPRSDSQKELRGKKRDSEKGSGFFGKFFGSGSKSKPPRHHSPPNTRPKKHSPTEYRAKNDLSSDSRAKMPKEAHPSSSRRKDRGSQETTHKHKGQGSVEYSMEVSDSEAAKTDGEELYNPVPKVQEAGESDSDLYIDSRQGSPTLPPRDRPVNRAERERENDAWRRNSNGFENVRGTPIHPLDSVSSRGYPQPVRYYGPEGFEGPMPPRFFGEMGQQAEPPRARGRGRSEGMYGPPEGYDYPPPPPQGFAPPPPMGFPPPPPGFIPGPPPPGFVFVPGPPPGHPDWRPSHHGPHPPGRTTYIPPGHDPEDAIIVEPEEEEGQSERLRRRMNGRHREERSGRRR